MVVPLLYENEKGPVLPFIYVSGRVISNGTGVGGVALILSGYGTIYTNPDGSYKISQYPGFTGTITPSALVGSFEPQFRTYVYIIGSRLNQDYVLDTAITADATSPTADSGEITADRI